MKNLARVRWRVRLMGLMVRIRWVNKAGNRQTGKSNKTCGDDDGWMTGWVLIHQVDVCCGRRGSDIRASSCIV